MITRITITESKIEKVSRDWCNLLFKTELSATGPRLYIIKKRNSTPYGYIDLRANTVHPHPTGICYQEELTHILDELRDKKVYMNP